MRTFLFFGALIALSTYSTELSAQQKSRLFGRGEDKLDAEIAASTPEAEENAGRVLDLRSLIEEALRKNALEQIRQKQFSIIDIRRQNLIEKFWVPNATFDVNASNHRYDRIYTSSSGTAGAGSQVSPNGNYGVTIKDFTIFNWGRDYLQYLNDRFTITRDNQRLVEARRRLRFQIVGQYFNLVRVKQILKIKREQLRQYSFVHRLTREKLQLRKISSQEYYQTRSEFLRSQTEYQQSLFEVTLEEEKMANILADEFRPAYRTTEQLKYTQIGTSLDDSIKMALEQSPIFRDARLVYDNASRSYDKVLKDNLPLPKFSVNFGTYQQQFGPQGNQWNRSTLSGSRNIEVVAALNMSWTLIGDNGFFNYRQNEAAFLDKKIAEINYFNTKRELEVKVRTIHKTIKFLEQKVAIADYQYRNAQSNFDTTLDNYVGGNTNYPNIKLSLDNFVNAGINSENVKFDHLMKKIELSDYMGMDDLPGENFETLAVR